MYTVIIEWSSSYVKYGNDLHALHAYMNDINVSHLSVYNVINFIGEVIHLKKCKTCSYLSRVNMCDYNKKTTTKKQYVSYWVLTSIVSRIVYVNRRNAPPGVNERYHVSSDMSGNAHDVKYTTFPLLFFLWYNNISPDSFYFFMIYMLLTFYNGDGYSNMCAFVL